MKFDPAPAGDMGTLGWTLQFTIEAERVQEYVELYESLGNEVRVKPAHLGSLQEDACATCLDAASGRYLAIHTRSRKAEAEE